MKTNQCAGVVFGIVAMALGAALTLAAPSFQARVNALYRRNPHLQFDFGWSEHRTFVGFTRFVGVALFGIGAALTYLLIDR